MKIVVGTAVLALFVSLDGDGSTTYMITAAAMLPLYKRLGMSRLMLACVIMLAGGVMNILPWGGPTARAASALGVDVGDDLRADDPADDRQCDLGRLRGLHAGPARTRRRVGAIDVDGDRRRAPDDRRHVAPTARPSPAAAAVGQLRADRVPDGRCWSWALLPLPVLFMIAFAIAADDQLPAARRSRRSGSPRTPATCCRWCR